MEVDGQPSGMGGRAGAGTVLEVSAQVYRAQALNLWKVIALIVIPARIAAEAAYALSLPAGVHVRNGDFVTNAGQPTATNALATAVGVGISVLAAALAIGALSKCVLDHFSGRPVDWRSSLRFAHQRLASLVWLSLLAAAALFAGFALFIVPGIWLLAALSPAVPALMFERIGPLRALRRSLELVRGRWWATFGVIALALALVVGVPILLSIIFGAIESGAKISSVALLIVLDGISGALSAMISYPFLAVVCGVIYIALRIRKEGLDVASLATGIGPGRLGS
ncbi:MAG: hypothetical protein ABSG43_13855 [Solirubrobacteraceae bacterium]|jgi:hypothetical protein